MKMTLTSAQKRDLKQISNMLREFEKAVVENSIDLDVYMTGYGDDGIQIYETEIISQKEKAGKRKKIFEKQSAPEKKKVFPQRLIESLRNEAFLLV